MSNIDLNITYVYKVMGHPVAFKVYSVGVRKSDNKKTYYSSLEDMPDLNMESLSSIIEYEVPIMILVTKSTDYLLSIKSW